jgi:murein DD-endopeptidase MepM/ murein hydrolase activator NlpD
MLKRLREQKTPNMQKNSGCLPFFLIIIVAISLVIFSQNNFKKDFDYFMRGEANIFKVISDFKASYSENMTYPDFIMPLGGNVTSPFGERINPITNIKEIHTGIDIDINNGTDVIAAETGKVIKVASDARFGNYIIIEHNKAFKTCYAHLDEVLKQEGSEAAKGEKIGVAGSTGVVTGKHLHFEIRKNEERVNPKIYIKNENN